MTSKKTLTAQKLIQSSVVMARLDHRKRYVNRLIRRLRHVPQILPGGHGMGARTRLDHCNNIVGIVAGTAFTPAQKKLQKELMIAAMMHDIGHAPFGHASERAINAWLQQDYFSNDRQSARLLFSAQDANAQPGLPIFQTSPMRRIADIRPAAAHAPDQDNASAATSCKSGLLDFLDDLENVVGDTGDLCRNKMANTGPVARELGIPARFEVQDTVQIADQILQRFGTDRSFHSLLALVQHNSALGTLLREAREEVMAARLACTEITLWDQLAHDQTIDICDSVASELRPDEVIPRSWLVDIIASVTLE